MPRLTPHTVEIRMDTAYVKADGRLVIPARLRRKLGIKPGTTVCFVERDLKIIWL